MARSIIPSVVLSVLTACSAAEPQGGTANAATSSPPPAAPINGPRLSLPLACVVGESCEVQNHVDADPGPGVKDYRCGPQTYEAHGGVDIRLLDMAAQRRGVDVLAAAPGQVARLRDGVSDVSVRVAGPASIAGQECGNGVVIDHGGGWETQYCHLARGSMMVKQGDTVTAGQPIARVGLSGNTEYPHLHLSVRKAGVIVDPYRPEAVPGTCDPASPGVGLWDPAAAKAVTYLPGAVLNAGFAGAQPTMEAVEAGDVAAPSTADPALIAYVRAINLQAGDVQSLSVADPAGGVLVQNTLAPLGRAKAQYLLYVGKRTPAGGWRRGRYTASYVVTRAGKPVLKQNFELAI
ncbi:M23 family metallopeptidase [Phenylobacterium sp.]|uniref:M23 family metallopeptidase n=1 Tax=Phenylobacterium sp. TaxID=1871053 RepID=UPI00273694B7|nr:M23 family metallopeptidase [Phenylobacterium sp.]MDP3856078.1 M23 family metallopeptidase [Phenylobacterium sp.]